MEKVEQVNIKNRTYYFYTDITNLDEFDKSKIKVDSKNLNIRKKLQKVMK